MPVREKGIGLLGSKLREIDPWNLTWRTDRMETFLVSTKLRSSNGGTPFGSYAVDAEALRRARAGVPKGEYHRM